HSLSRIDHIFVTQDLMNDDGIARLDYPPRSDHRALSVIFEHERSESQERRPWRLNASHLHHATFEQRCEKILQDTHPYSPDTPAAEMARGWSVRKKYIRKYATRYGMELAQRTDLAMDTNLKKLRILERELIHDMPLARQDAWLHETAEMQAAVSARVAANLEGRRTRARARRVELNEKSSKYFYRLMKAKNSAAYVSELLAANNQPVSTPEAIKERLG
ncbi:hypothetical protein FBU31_007746, partial [Coemansia sp. 'formosensis']